MLGIAVLAVSTSAPIIAACAAPALAIAFWRCFLGTAATAGWWAVRRTRVSVPRHALGAAVGGGVLLALHFAAWIPSLRYTSVASSTALVATQPVWAALLARARGAQVSRWVWVGIAISLSGVLLLTGIDFALDPASLFGDGLALLGAMLAAGYVSVGEAARRHLPTAVYSTIGYGTAAVVLLPLALLAGASLTGYEARDWWLIIALTVLAQLLGHTLINRVLGSVSATVTSLAILFERPGAVIIAAAWLGLVPPLAVLPALALILLGLVVVIRAADLPVPVADPAG
jgi:drug/metabolite transporter (DMT)-like permease